MQAGQQQLEGEPTWEIAHLFPNQGDWTKEEYLSLNTNRLVELSNGVLELLPMPTMWHQLIVRFWGQKLWDYVMGRKLGFVLLAPFRIQLWEGKFREPDVAFMLAANEHRI